MPAFSELRRRALRDGTPRRAAVLAAIGFTAAAAFQVALALGAPLGIAAWGGRHRVLPAALRLASTGAAAILVAAAAVVVGRAGFWGARIPSVFRIGIWLVICQMSLNTVTNFASPSPWERYLMSVLSGTLTVLCIIVSRAPRPRT
ncbi:MAG TPA: hypothetical protein VN848_07990 [Gemmatimonadales bacterium]|nr:hypothetical protein [Gemmatimonadales bacterium]